MTSGRTIHDPPPPVHPALRHFREFASFVSQGPFDAATASVISRTVAAALFGDSGDDDPRRIRHRLTEVTSLLNETVPEMFAARTRITDLLGAGGTAWDPLESTWRDITWETLERTHRFLAENESIDRLARFVTGRSTVSENRAKQTPPKAPRSRSARVAPLVRPDQLEPALLALPGTDTIALVHATERRRPVRFTDGEGKNPREMNDDSTPVPTEPAPVILCVDTSGSMGGTPTAVAGALALALMREALESNRATHLFLYSQSLQHLELSRIETSIVPFSRILAGGGAGSDIAPAVHAALDLAERGPPAADIVLVSDFHFPTLAPRTMTRVGDLQAKMEHRIHALTIHRMPIEDPLNIFDFRWHFNTSHSGSQGISTESFRAF